MTRPVSEGVGKPWTSTRLFVDVHGPVEQLIQLYRERDTYKVLTFKLETDDDHGTLIVSCTPGRLTSTVDALQTMQAFVARADQVLAS